MDEALKVVAVKRDDEGNMAQFKLSNEQVVSFSECQDMINEGKLPGLISTVGKNGVEIIRSAPDGDLSNNLSQLPEF